MSSVHLTATTLTALTTAENATPPAEPAAVSILTAALDAMVATTCHLRPATRVLFHTAKAAMPRVTASSANKDTSTLLMPSVPSATTSIAENALHQD